MEIHQTKKFLNSKESYQQNQIYGIGENICKCFPDEYIPEGVNVKKICIKGTHKIQQPHTHKHTHFLTI